MMFQGVLTIAGVRGQYRIIVGSGLAVLALPMVGPILSALNQIFFCTARPKEYNNNSLSFSATYVRT